MSRQPESVSKECECSWPESAACDGSWPIVYEGSPPSYYLCLSEKGGRAPIRHCPSCGGLLPSRTASFVERDTDELVAAKKLLAQVGGIDDMRCLLGEPDVVRPRNSVVCQYEYNSLWQSFRVIVLEYANGSLAMAFPRRRKET